MIQLIALILFQQPTAEETLKQIEETLWKAKTIRAKVRLDLVQGEQKGTRTTTLLLKEGNKLKITEESEFDGQKSNAWSISDGQRGRLYQRQGDVDHARDFDIPRDLRSGVTATLVRMGCMDLTTVPHRMAEYGRDPKERWALQDVKFGEKEGDLQSLTYAPVEAKGKMTLKLWYDPRDFALKKRTLSYPEQKASLTEIYEEFTLNKEIPDETFQLPKK